MKLSKVQQVVVDKMRQGWELRLLESGNAYLTGKNYEQHDVHKHTFNSIRRWGIVERRGSYINGWIYQLTEKYRSNEG
jgi:hypothetical protein